MINTLLFTLQRVCRGTYSTESRNRDVTSYQRPRAFRGSAEWNLGADDIGYRVGDAPTSAALAGQLLKSDHGPMFVAE